MAGKKSGNFDADGIEKLAKDKPIVYEIEDNKGNLQYVGWLKEAELSSA